MTASVEPPGGGDELSAARRRIIEAGDTARRIVARDLHDGAQQLFVAALIRLQLAQEKWETDSAGAKGLLDTGIAQAEAGLQSLRELAAGIHPPILAHQGLSAAVDALAARAPMEVTLDLMQERLPPAWEASLYFFISEALTNVVKHAQASQASVRIWTAGDSLIVEVIDNGVGGADLAGEGVGLQGLVDRVGALSGDLTLTSAAGSGTTLHAVIPMPPRATA